VKGPARGLLLREVEVRPGVLGDVRVRGATMPTSEAEAEAGSDEASAPSGRRS